MTLAQEKTAQPNTTVKKEEVDEKHNENSSETVVGQGQGNIAKTVDEQASSSTSIVTQLVRLKDAPVAKKNKEFIEELAIVEEERGNGWYTVEVRVKSIIKWRGKDNMETIRDWVVRLKDAPVAKKNKEFIEELAIVREEGGNGWYIVEARGKSIKWRGKDNMETIHDRVVCLKNAPVAKENKEFIRELAILREERGNGWYTVEVRGKSIIKWRGKDNMTLPV